MANGPMVVCIPKACVIVFNLAFPWPYKWTINGATQQVCLTRSISRLFYTEAAFPLACETQADNVWGLGSPTVIVRLQCLSTVRFWF